MPTREYIRIKKILTTKNDKELRIIALKLHKAHRVMKKKIYALYEEMWKNKDIQRGMKYLEQETLIERGIRKGKGCKAIEKDCFDNQTCHCLARKNGYTWAKNLDRLYSKYCATCRLKKKDIKARVTYKKVFN